jgi:hypothetical protein
VSRFSNPKNDIQSGAIFETLVVKCTFKSSCPGFKTGSVHFRMNQQERRTFARFPFSPEEDAQLRALVDSHGQTDWVAIAECMPGRSSRQCKERWMHYLSPDITQRNWTEEEDERLIQKVDEMGRRWQLLVPFFPGRTDVGLKNRYNVLQRKSVKEFKIAMKLPLKIRRNSPPMEKVSSPTFSEQADWSGEAPCDNFGIDFGDIWDVCSWPDLEFL